MSSSSQSPKGFGKIASTSLEMDADKIELAWTLVKKGEIKNGLALVALQWFFLEYLKD